MEWAHFKCLFWNASESILKLMGFFQAVFLCDADLVIELSYNNDNKCQNFTRISKKIFFDCRAGTGFRFQFG